MEGAFLSSTNNRACLCSYDGVPFLMHDKTLRRTTNVEEVFPERAYEHSSMFNWTDLEKLNAGEWFLQVGSKEPWDHSSFPGSL